jgi:hypothetical protein
VGGSHSRCTGILAFCGTRRACGGLTWNSSDMQPCSTGSRPMHSTIRFPRALNDSASASDRDRVQSCTRSILGRLEATIPQTWSSGSSTLPTSPMTRFAQAKSINWGAFRIRTTHLPPYRISFLLVEFGSIRPTLAFAGSSHIYKVRSISVISQYTLCSPVECLS